MIVVGVEAEDCNIELLLSEVKGKDFAELIASGREKLASVPSGGGAVAVSAATGGGAAAAAPAAEAKEEKKVEEKEESDDVSFKIIVCCLLFGKFMAKLMFVLCYLCAGYGIQLIRLKGLK